MICLAEVPILSCGMLLNAEPPAALTFPKGARDYSSLSLDSLELPREGRTKDLWTGLSIELLTTKFFTKIGLVDSLIQAGARLIFIEPSDYSAHDPIVDPIPDYSKARALLGDLSDKYGSDRIKYSKILQSKPGKNLWLRDVLGFFTKDNSGEVVHYGSFASWYITGKFEPTFQKDYFKNFAQNGNIKARPTPRPVVGGNIVPIGDDTIAMSSTLTRMEVQKSETEFPIEDFSERLIDWCKELGRPNVIFVDPFYHSTHIDLMVAQVGDTVFIPEFDSEAFSRTLSLSDSYEADQLNRTKNRLDKAAAQFKGAFNTERLLIPLSFRILTYDEYAGDPPFTTPRFLPIGNILQVLNSNSELNLILPKPLSLEPFKGSPIDLEAWPTYEEENRRRLIRAGADNVKFLEQPGYDMYGSYRCLTAPVPDVVVDKIALNL